MVRLLSEQELIAAATAVAAIGFVLYDTDHSTLTKLVEIQRIMRKGGITESVLNDTYLAIAANVPELMALEKGIIDVGNS